MLKLIPGLKGEGKTKSLIEQVNKAVEEAKGDIICIECGKALTYDIPYSVRLVQMDKGNSVDFFKGFICGLHNGNYDITDIFIDGIYKLVKASNEHEMEEFFSWCNKYGDANGIRFTATIDRDFESASTQLKEYF